MTSRQSVAIPTDTDATTESSDDGVRSAFASWLRRRKGVFTAVAGCLPPALYLLFILHFSSNGLLFDDWNMVPFVHNALDGHFLWGQWWSQYGEPRLPLVRLELLAFAKATDLNTRWAIIFSAFVLIVSYILVLQLFRRYLGRRLSPLPVLIVGVIWFSLADAQSALLAFEVGWYLVVFGFIGVLFALLVPQRRGCVWFGIAVIAAVIATLGAIQGFAVWPVGALVILWCQPRTHRMYAELGVWAGAFLASTGIYLLGYNYSLTSCSPLFGCTPTSALAHPLTTMRFFIVLIGNVVPGQFTSNHPGTYLGPAPTSVVRFEVIGVFLLAACIVIIVSSVRDRATKERVPLPLLMIAFSLLFDATIVWGRIGEGVAGSVLSNRYVMPNIVLLAAIVIYAWAHKPTRAAVCPGGDRASNLAWVPILSLAVVVVLQVVIATDVGVRAGRNTQTFVVDGSRLAVNLDSIPSRYRGCELSHYWIPVSEISDAAGAHLAEFSASAYVHYRALGPPPLLAACRDQAAASGAG